MKTIVVNTVSITINSSSRRTNLGAIDVLIMLSIMLKMSGGPQDVLVIIMTSLALVMTLEGRAPTITILNKIRRPSRY